MSVGAQPISIPDRAWYVVQTKPRQEFRALEHLQNQGFHCSLPTIPAEKMRRGRLVLESEPLFSRYLFIELGADTRNWGAIRSTRGVSWLVSFGGAPARLPDPWLEEFQQRGQPARYLFEPGQRVTVAEGAFSGLEGIYQMPDGESRAIVLLTLLSKPAKGSFAIQALRRAG
jgi:transcriptional antiterminator RfaH